MFKKSFEGQLQHYLADQEHGEVKDIVDSLVNDGQNLVKEIRAGKQELEKLKDLRNSLTNREYVEYLEKAHGKSMQEEIDEALKKIDARYEELIESQKEGAELLRDYQELAIKSRSRLREIETSKDQFYEDMLTILNEKELPDKDRI